MKKLILIFVLFILHSSNAETNIISGAYTMIPNPATTVPSLPGMVAAVTANDVDYILTVNGKWFWEEFLWEGWTPERDDRISVTGVISEHTDLLSRTYFEIEVADAFPVMTQSITVSNNLCTISITGLTPGSTNTLEKTADLNGTNWKTVTTFWAASDSTNLTDTVNETSTNCFYRVGPVQKPHFLLD